MNTEKLNKVLAAIKKVSDDIESGKLVPGIRCTGKLVDGVPTPCCTHGHIQAELGQEPSLNGLIVSPLAEALGLHGPDLNDEDAIHFAINKVVRENDRGNIIVFEGNRAARIVDALDDLSKALVTYAKNHAQE